MNPDPLKTMAEGMGEPAVPAGFERTVMARIARLADERPRPAMRPVPIPKRATTPAWYETPAWGASVAGLVLFFASWIGGHVEVLGLSAIAAQPEVAMASLVNMPTSPLAVLGLTCGAALYLAGMFARSEDRAAPPTTARKVLRT